MYQYILYPPDSVKKKQASTFFNSNCDAIMMQDTGILNIDSQEDYELMQVIAEYLFKKEPFKEIYKSIC